MVRLAETNSPHDTPENGVGSHIDRGQYATHAQNTLAEASSQTAHEGRLHTEGESLLRRSRRATTRTMLIAVLIPAAATAFAAWPDKPRSIIPWTPSPHMDSASSQAKNGGVSSHSEHLQTLSSEPVTASLTPVANARLWTFAPIPPPPPEPTPPPPAPPPPPPLNMQLLGITRIDARGPSSSADTSSPNASDDVASSPQFEAILFDAESSRIVRARTGTTLSGRTVESVTATTITFAINQSRQHLSLRPAIPSASPSGDPR